MGMVHKIDQVNYNHTNAFCLPPSDIIVWEELQRKKAPGVRFGRELLVGDHVVSLCCRASRIAVEFDLPSPEHRSQEDEGRIDTLIERGYTIVCVRSNEVYDNLIGVCEAIRQVATECARRAGRTKQAPTPYLTDSDSPYANIEIQEGVPAGFGIQKRQREAFLVEETRLQDDGLILSVESIELAA
jgi:very-short-patch-repair endonuclease